MRTAPIETFATAPKSPQQSRSFGRQVFLFGLLMLLAMAVLLIQTSIVATTGYRVEQLSNQKANQERLILEMSAAVAALRSLDRIEYEARTRLNMVTPTEYIYVSVDALPNKPTPLLQKSLRDKQSSLTEPQPSSWWESIPLVRNIFRSEP